MVKIRYIAAAVLLLLAIWAVIQLFPGEEKRVKKQFHLMAKWVSKEHGEHTVTMAYKTKSMESLFYPKCEVNLPPYSFSGLFTPEELAGYASQGRLYFDDLQLRFYDLAVAFRDRGTVEVNFTAKLTGKTKNGELVDETHELVCLLHKTEKGWLFGKIEVVEVLKR